MASPASTTTSADRYLVLQRISPHLWATVHMFSARLMFLAQLRAATQPSVMAHITAEFVRELLHVGEIISKHVPKGKPSSWRWSASSYVITVNLCAVVYAVSEVAQQYATELSPEDLQKVIQFGQRALEYFQSGAKRLFEIPSHGWRSILTPKSQKKTMRMQKAVKEATLRCTLARAYLRLPIDDLARNHDMAFQHYELAIAVLENEEIPALSILASSVRAMFATSLLEYPTEYQRAPAEQACNLLTKARENVARFRSTTDVQSIMGQPRLAMLLRFAGGGLKLALTGGAPPDIVDALSPAFEAWVATELGVAYSQLGDYGEACEQLDIALTKTTCVDTDPIVGRIHIHRANAYLERSDGDRLQNLRIAKDSADVAIRLTGEGVFVAPYVRSLLVEARICHALNETRTLSHEQRTAMFATAARNLRRGARLARNAGLYALLQETAFWLGKVFLVNSDIPRAFRSLVLSARIADRLESSSRTIRSSRFWAFRGTPLYELLVATGIDYRKILGHTRRPDSLLATAVFRSLLTYAERSRTVFLQTELANRKLVPPGATQAELASFFVLRHKWQQSELRYLEKESSLDADTEQPTTGTLKLLAQRRDEAEREYLQALQSVRDQFHQPEYDPDRLLMPIRHRDLWTAINKISGEEPTAFVEYYFCGNALMIFVLGPTFHAYRRTELSLANFESVADRWQQGFEVRRNSPGHWERAYLAPTLNQLSELAEYPVRIIKQWEQQFNRQISRVFIVPHRLLHHIPLHALPLSDGNRWSDTAAIRYVPSGSVLARLLHTQYPLRGKAVAVAYAAPEEPLMFHIEEANAVAQALRGTLLTGRAATKYNVALAIQDADYVHFSTHGYFDAAAPLDAAISLSSMDQDGSAEELTLGDIFETLQLPNAHVVVLSACETGLTKVERFHEEYIGLPAGFLYAGAKTVISTLWRVNDLATWLLMRTMVRYLAKDFRPTIALSRAQKDFQKLTKADVLRAVEQAASAHNEPRIGELMRQEAARLLQRTDEAFPFAGLYWWAGFVVSGLG